jgi:hypothetical protein
MEPYDIGDNVEIIRSLNPNLAFVTTSFDTGPSEKHRVWYELLHGARGHIIWDEKHDIVEPDGSIGPRGREVRPYWNELRNGIGALLINSRWKPDPIAIHYSQASMRTEWMLAQRGKGDAWMDRMSSTESKDSNFLKLRDSYCRLIEDHGLQYDFVSSDQLEQGELLDRGYRILILPRSSSLSKAEADAITAFVRRGGTLIVDGEAGIFDQHGRSLPQSSVAPLLAGNTGQGRVVRLNALDYYAQRISGTGSSTFEAMSKVLSQSQIAPAFKVVDPAGKPVPEIETYTFQNGALTIVGLLANPPIEQDELGPLKAQSAARFQKQRSVRLVPPEPLYAYDLRARKTLGRVKNVALVIDAYEPTILAFSQTPLPKLHVSAPQTLQRGETGTIGLSFATSSAAAEDVFHIDVARPDGQSLPQYSGNMLASHGTALLILPLAYNDPPGKWSVTVKDVASTDVQTVHVDVE